MVVVTHEMGFAREVASRVMFMDGGKIMEENIPQKFFDHPENPRLQEFLSKVYKLCINGYESTQIIAIFLYKNLRFVHHFVVLWVYKRS